MWVIALQTHISHQQRAISRSHKQHRITVACANNSKWRTYENKCEQLHMIHTTVSAISTQAHLLHLLWDCVYLPHLLKDGLRRNCGPMLISNILYGHCLSMLWSCFKMCSLQRMRTDDNQSKPFITNGILQITWYQYWLDLIRHFFKNLHLRASESRLSFSTYSNTPLTQRQHTNNS